MKKRRPYWQPGLEAIGPLNPIAAGWHPPVIWIVLLALATRRRGALYRVTVEAVR
jgi:hypothetical protein